jgi:leucyl-tRNA synthetase
MFLGPWEQGGPWNPRGVEGVVRFLNRAWSLVTDTPEATAAAPTEAEVRDLQRALHQTIRRVTQDLERFSYNTLIAGLMEFTNTLQKTRSTAVTAHPVWHESLETLALLLAPTAPHVAEEMWEQLGKPYSIHRQPWPTWSEELAAEDAIEIVVQVNGKLRDRLTMPSAATETEVREAALACEKVLAATDGKTVRKVIYVPGKLLNVVVG